LSGVQNLCCDYLAELQARVEHRSRVAQDLTRAELLCQEHLFCAVKAPPLYEGHLIKVICMVTWSAGAGLHDVHETEAANRHENAAPDVQFGAGSTATCVLMNKSTASGLALEVGKDFLVLQPWSAMNIAHLSTPIVLAHIAVLCTKPD
jgi:hypothetical protein